MQIRLLFLFIFVCTAQVTFAQFANTSTLRKYAIVIGNADYQYVTSLEAPTNDAETVADILRDKCGFVVEKYQNLSQAAFKKRLEKWRENAKDYDIILFYFSGHGIVKKGHQYLVATDADTSAVSIAKNTDLENIKESLNPNGANRKLLLVIDACRTSSVSVKQSVEDNDQTSVRKKGEPGLEFPATNPQEYLNTKTVFASSTNRGSGDGSVYSRYTEILIEHLNAYADKKTVSPFFGGVKDAVVRKYATQGNNIIQFPISEGDFSEEFYLKEPAKMKLPVEKCKELFDCSLCKGAGMLESTSTCRTCNGTGNAVCIECGGKAVANPGWICMTCHGRPTKCVTCQGNRRISVFHDCTQCGGSRKIEREVDCK
jgi:hypothetical protein